MAKSKSNSVTGRIQIFADFSALVEYTQSLVIDEPQTVAEKTFTYLACRAPRLWNKNEINLLIVLARLEATLANLTSQQTQYLAKEILLPSDIKSIKEISTACASVVTQLHTLTTRLGVSAAQLNGSAMRSEAMNTNSREVANLVLSKSTNSTTDAQTLDIKDIEARRKATAFLDDLPLESITQ
ncbi:hypothetical protein [Polynucleobacter sp. JS-JIR-5-A7]|uniref:hypothetical protein n=1 Tax=Polynucleobacter sp. JS-JIR-5-A7 TaxID=1758395 RepID=UPI001BFE5566|nr:hypothetical protein [Polynucleobacter sp. JS-JIR-5-A7]QWE06054.1 hypothetical protein AOC29_08005 [Polynucleobacter sp. JS-JIR-5-A7]